MAKRKNRNRRSVKKRVGVTRLESFVLGIYKNLDRDIKQELDILKRERRIEPTCKKCCFHCCRQSIPATYPEGHIITQYIRRVFTHSALDALHERIGAWYKWVQEELPTFEQKGVEEHAAIYEFGPSCPLLVNDLCSVFPVRPIICRSHFVDSDPRCCIPLTDPASRPGKLNVLESVRQEMVAHYSSIRKYIERTGGSFDSNASLLVHLLAVGLEDTGRPIARLPREFARGIKRHGSLEAGKADVGNS
jgi:Fe-S-cluster containining protein